MSALPKDFHNKMNTIKFRIWNPEEKKMVESGATPMMLHSFFEYTARFHTQFEMPYQQFTGLLDKLGKEIYEGDIIDIYHKESDKTPDEYRNLVAFQYVVKDIRKVFKTCGMGKGEEKQREIIGNIYET